MCDVVVSTLPCLAARGLACYDRLLLEPLTSIYLRRFKKIAKNATSYLSVVFVVDQTVVCISCIFRSNQSNFLDF